MASNVSSGANSTRGRTPTEGRATLTVQRGGFRGFVDRVRGRIATAFQRTRGR